MLICVLYPEEELNRESFQDEIKPTENEVRALESQKITLSCNYTFDSPNNLQWYRQYPRSKPEFIILTLGTTDSENTEGRFNVTNKKESKQVHLELSSAEVTDSALYYCALQPTVTGNP
ncbi:hypothetical protein JZ751_019730 [Albula glossodonta]|uniref:Ig-like domain-containing protein n=1 Tax=Albula glossodonta TaxID=121402 RepID=A0A8T2N3V0_9TELE|nr:hypothetical protein JZ751_019730 [Albula glossodonta]